MKGRTPTECANKTINLFMHTQSQGGHRYYESPFIFFNKTKNLLHKVISKKMRLFFARSSALGFYYVLCEFVKKKTMFCYFTVQYFTTASDCDMVLNITFCNNNTKHRIELKRLFLFLSSYVHLVYGIISANKSMQNILDCS